MLRPIAQETAIYQEPAPMRVHHLNCATMCPLLGGLLNPEKKLVCHCLLVETPAAGLVLAGLPPELLLVPLSGHTRGHAAVAVREDSGRWLLHAGDAYFYRDETDPENPRCTPGLRVFQRMAEMDRAQRLANQQRLREL